jgi:hypothetical protein
MLHKKNGPARRARRACLCRNPGWGKDNQQKVLHLDTSQAAFSPRSPLARCRRLFSACVLRTASANISYSSALVFGGSRVDFHEVM